MSYNGQVETNDQNDDRPPTDAEKLANIIPEWKGDFDALRKGTIAGPRDWHGNEIKTPARRTPEAEEQYRRGVEQKLGGLGEAVRKDEESGYLDKHFGGQEQKPVPEAQKVKDESYQTMVANRFEEAGQKEREDPGWAERKLADKKAQGVRAGEEYARKTGARRAEETHEREEKGKQSARHVAAFREMSGQGGGIASASQRLGGGRNIGTQRGGAGARGEENQSRAPARQTPKESKDASQTTDGGPPKLGGVLFWMTGGLAIAQDFVVDPATEGIIAFGLGFSSAIITAVIGIPIAILAWVIKIGFLVTVWLIMWIYFYTHGG
ncbi:MAG: hypothetical protein AAB869_03560, partial [Patescibacteria group bacterium]